MQRKAAAKWEGGLKDGKGTITTDSGVLSKTQYSFSTRFENGIGTNPEELIAAAHASCFSMALAAQLTDAGVRPEWIYTTATVTLERQPAGYVMSGVHLDVHARIPGVDHLVFDRVANNAKSNCPVSKALRLNITMEAKLSAM